MKKHDYVLRLPTVQKPITNTSTHVTFPTQLTNYYTSLSLIICGKFDTSMLFVGVFCHALCHLSVTGSGYNVSCVADSGSNASLV